MPEEPGHPHDQVPDVPLRQTLVVLTAASPAGHSVRRPLEGTLGAAPGHQPRRERTSGLQGQGPRSERGGRRVPGSGRSPSGRRFHLGPRRRAQKTRSHVCDHGSRVPANVLH